MIKRFAIMAFMIAEILWTGGGPRLAAQPTTKPSFKDTDGDGYPDGPDVVVYYPGLVWRRLIGEDKNGNGKYEPKGEDGILGTADDEYDPNNRNSHPTVPPMSDDTDGDGLSDELEAEIGTNPLDIDSDDDGLSDGDEYYGRGACFVDGASFPTNPLDPDSDHDGIPDGTELGVTQPIRPPAASGPILGTDLGATFPFLDFDGQWKDIPTFVPDADGGLLKSFTDPLNSDTNADGIIDGWQDYNKNGRFDAGEQDPVIGLRGIPGHRSTMSHGNRHFWLPLPDPDVPTPNPPSPQQSLYFYWGASDATTLSWTVSPPASASQITISPASITRGQGEFRHEIVFSLATGRETDYLALGPVLNGSGSPLDSYSAKTDTRLVIPITSLRTTNIVTPISGQPYRPIAMAPPLEDVEEFIDLILALPYWNNFTARSWDDLKTDWLGISPTNLPYAFDPFPYEYSTNGIMERELNIIFLVNDGIDMTPTPNIAAGNYIASLMHNSDSLVLDDGTIKQGNNPKILAQDWFGRSPQGSSGTTICQAQTVIRQTIGLMQDGLAKQDGVPEYNTAVNDLVLHAGESNPAGTNSFGLDIFAIPFIGPSNAATATLRVVPGTRDNEVMWVNNGQEIWNANVLISYSTLYSNGIEALLFPSDVPRIKANLSWASKQIAHELCHFLGAWYHLVHHNTNVANLNLGIERNDEILSPLGRTWRNRRNGWQNYWRTHGYPTFTCIPSDNYFTTLSEARHLMAGCVFYTDWFDPQSIATSGFKAPNRQDTQGLSILFNGETMLAKDEKEEIKSYAKLLVTALKSKQVVIQPRDRSQP